MVSESTRLVALVTLLFSVIVSSKITNDRPKFYRECTDFRPNTEIFHCYDDETKCVAKKHICDSLVDCPDGSDEDPAECQWEHKEYCDNGFAGKWMKSKPLEKWECDNHMCIEKCRRCDGEEDCPDGSDEDTRCKERGLLKELDDIEYQCQRDSGFKRLKLSEL